MEEWTEGRKRAFITSTLRGGMRRWPPKWQVLQQAYVGQMVNPKTKRESKHYKCAGCSECYPSKDVQIDHIVPVVCPTKGFETWDIFIQRLYCSNENLQVLCKDCHKRKTLDEKQTRTNISTASSGQRSTKPKSKPRASKATNTKGRVSKRN